MTALDDGIEQAGGCTEPCLPLGMSPSVACANAFAPITRCVLKHSSASGTRRKPKSVVLRGSPIPAVAEDRSLFWVMSRNIPRARPWRHSAEPRYYELPREDWPG